MSLKSRKVKVCVMKKAQRSVALILIIASLFALLPTSYAASYTGTVNTDKVFFRIKASTSAGYYTTLNKGTKVTVTGTSGNFYAVTHGKNKGYIMKKFVTVSSSAQSALNGKAASSTATATKKTSKYASATSISALGSVPAATKKGSSGEAVEKLQAALKIKKFYYATVDGQYGDATASAVKRFQNYVGLPATGTADKTTLNVLFGKTTVSSAKASSTTTVASDPKMKGITKISQITVPATTTKGNSGKNVLALQQALKIKGYYKAPINSRYDDNTVAAVKAFQRAHGLTADGIAGNGTIKKLFGKNAANYTFATEKLDWYHGGSGRIPNGATFTVKDVATGKTFTGRRLFGSNHMDTEPLTKADTAVLKSIYGGYSWSRRAILVKYNGHVYAASMNGMPHGTSTLDNNWPGHFCIHFYGSKTHGTKRVDSAHQNAIARAMKATW